MSIFLYLSPFPPLVLPLSRENNLKLVRKCIFEYFFGFFPFCTVNLFCVAICSLLQRGAMCCACVAVCCSMLCLYRSALHVSTRCKAKI